MPQSPASYVDWLGHHIFEYQTFVFFLGLSVIFHLISKPQALSKPSISSVNAVTLAHIGALVCFAYSGSNGDTVHSSEVNDMG